MIMHEITLDGYAAQCAEQPIRLGTAASYGVETLSVMRKGEWVDYDIIVAFHPPNGESVQIRLESDNVVSVPAEATAAAGTGELTFAGYTDGVTLQFKAGSGVNSVVAFSEWLEARPDASIFYCLATPIETPLTPAEIAAYKALTAYAPDTVVQASDGAGVKLDYQRDVNIVIKKLEDAIASMTTT